MSDFIVSGIIPYDELDDVIEQDILDEFHKKAEEKRRKFLHDEFYDCVPIGIREVNLR